MKNRSMKDDIKLPLRRFLVAALAFVALAGTEGSVNAQSLPGTAQPTAPVQIDSALPPVGVNCEEVLLGTMDQNASLTVRLTESQAALAQATATIRSSERLVFNLNERISALEDRLTRSQVRQTILDVAPTSRRIARRLRLVAEGNEESLPVARRLLRRVRAAVDYNNKTVSEFGFPLKPSTQQNLSLVTE